MAKKLNNKLCRECAERVAIPIWRNNRMCKQMGCAVTGKPVSCMTHCPMNYSFTEYETLMEKGVAFDKYRMTLEIKQLKQ